MERKITIEERGFYEEDYQMRMLKVNAPDGYESNTNVNVDSFCHCIRRYTFLPA